MAGAAGGVFGEADLKKTAQEEEDEDEALAAWKRRPRRCVREGFHAAGLVDEAYRARKGACNAWNSQTLVNIQWRRGGVEALDVGDFHLVEGVVVVPGDEVIAERRGEDADGQEEEEER